jgi:ubiquinone/menaquinone biosynthesis C-methylase UbiE
MAEASQFVGTIPDFYDRHLGSVIFEPYARDLAARVNVPRDGALLEVACGTGVVTRRLLERRAADVRVVATDLNPAMIEVARQAVGEAPRLEWRTADGTALPFEAGEFDEVVCQFGVMFFPDKPAGAREAKRVLKRGGRYRFNVWDAFARNPFGRITDETLTSFFPADPPLFYRTPFGFHDPATIRAMLEGAGFRDVTIEIVPKEIVSVSARDFATGLIRGNPVLNEIVERGSDPLAVEAALARALAREGGEAPFRSNTQALVVTAQA